MQLHSTSRDNKMSVFCYLSILAMVIELSSEVKQTGWFDITNCPPQYETDMENIKITSIQSNDGQADYEGTTKISCIKAEEKARKCDVFVDAGGVGYTFMTISSHSEIKRCKQLHFQVEVATTQLVSSPAPSDVGLNKV